MEWLRSLSGSADWELVKLAVQVLALAAQVLAAYLVARVAVRWALDRFKKEKLWERRATAYADMVAALAEMQRILGIWYDDETGPKRLSDEGNAKLRADYQAAVRRYQEVASLAKLLLPAETIGTLVVLERAREETKGAAQSWFESVDGELGAVQQAVVALVEQGRRQIGGE